MRRRPCPKSMSCNAISVLVLLFSLCNSNFALVTNAFTIPNPSWKVSSAHVSSSRPQSVNFDLTPRRTRLSLQAAAASSDLIPARRARVAFELKTLFRVLIPAILSGTAAFLTLPTLCFRVAKFVAHTTDPSKIGMLSDIVQSFISLVGLLYSIMMGQVFGFLYSQQEALYLALFDEVTEAKSLLEQVALVSQGRSMYLTCLVSIAKYVREDLLGGTGGDASSGDKSKIPASPSVTPSVILSARPADDPLESILYLTSVGIPGNIYDTVRSLRQARSRRLGAMQRKVPTIHILMMWMLGVTLILTFPTLIGVGGTSWATLPSAGFNIWTLQGILFGVATFSVVFSKMVLLELWRTKGGAYNVDSVLKVMVRGLECELDERMSEAKQTLKRSKGNK